MLFLLKCPHCGHSMKYQPMDRSKKIAGKSKRCVYCGKSFEAAKHVQKELG